MPVLVAMLASKMGISIRGYLHLKTAAELALDIQGWITSWSFPASLLVGGSGKKDGPPGRSGSPARPPRAAKGRWDWTKRLRRPISPSARWTDLDAVAKMTPEAALSTMRNSGLGAALTQRSYKPPPGTRKGQGFGTFARNTVG